MHAQLCSYSATGYNSPAIQLPQCNFCTGLHATILRTHLLRLRPALGLPNSSRSPLPRASTVAFVVFPSHLPIVPLCHHFASLISIFGLTVFISLYHRPFPSRKSRVGPPVRIRLLPTRGDFCHRPLMPSKIPDTRMRPSRPPDACVHSDGLLLLTRRRNCRTSSRGL